VGILLREAFSMPLRAKTPAPSKATPMDIVGKWERMVGALLQVKIDLYSPRALRSGVYLSHHSSAGLLPINFSTTYPASLALDYTGGLRDPPPECAPPSGSAAHIFAHTFRWRAQSSSTSSPHAQ
jgi:hypothetical protein